MFQRHCQAFTKSPRVIIAALLVFLCQVSFGMSVTSVPERMLLSATMKAADIGKSMVRTINDDALPGWYMYTYYLLT
jgi:hypothetical protein